MVIIVVFFIVEHGFLFLFLFPLVTDTTTTTTIATTKPTVAPPMTTHIQPCMCKSEPKVDSSENENNFPEETESNG